VSSVVLGLAPQAAPHTVKPIRPQAVMTNHPNAPVRTARSYLSGRLFRQLAFE
jgi:hypothetical protein